MNKYIKTDIEQGLQYLKTAIMNALADIESGEEEIILGEFVPFSLVVKCAEERGWKEDPNMDWNWTNGWEVDCWYSMYTSSNKKVCIESCLWKGLITKIYINEND